MTAATASCHEQFKAATREAWDRHAKGWNDHSADISNWLQEPTAAMLTMADIRPGARVIDVAAGAGDQTMEIAKRVGPKGSILATDLSPAILAFAAAKAQRAGCDNVESRIADGENLPVADGAFDAAVCRLGLMFFPDPGKGLREMFRALRPGGKACTMVFSAPDRNPCVGVLIQTALKHAGLPPRDPYQPGGLLSLGKPGLIEELFRQAGFERVASTAMAAPFHLPSAGAYLEFVRNSASPILQMLDQLAAPARNAAWDEMEQKLSAFGTPNGWEGPNELLLTVGCRP